MFVSTLILIPWIIYGFKNLDKKFLWLNQTKRSLLILFSFEILFWVTLMLLLKPHDPNVAGQGSFAWTYQFIYEKGIFPCFMIAEYVNGNLGDKIDAHFEFLYLLTALLMDYFLLLIISPKTIRKKKLRI